MAGSFRAEIDTEFNKMDSSKINTNINYPVTNNIRPLSSNIYNYPSNYNINTQELTNRNQFSDYDFRKISGGDINEYYNEIRKRKQQIRDQYKQIEQENYLNAQRKKQEKELEKEREKITKKELLQPPEELNNLIIERSLMKPVTDLK